MYKLITLCSIMIVSSCGFKVKGLESLENIEAKAEIETDIPDKISLEPDFDKAIKTCDDRYGKNTEESEECFQDFRDYYKTTVGFDFSGIIEFCEERYDTELEIDACQDELLNIVDTSELGGLQ